ncbi:tripartite tricarboxylate transporter substrate binding protein [Cupriavidus sp. SW-Y-13]|uniref:tripartite tricarboxylate transporter substrate binding protein n=1 Tax=Cupriavidus sp. SW-Y-13 TaxID=2653854 RepID=UPI0013659FC3|nr:tripartite tricarboxylate transporter substrate binding protein [Cupriavidus sp. SW-Y-13]MWL89049.1 tripartite tricarboxylate transporter substrate binding protein [Cupriavidus sp. SW-Y-13]
MKLASILAFAACTAVIGTASAQSYPQRPIRLIVPYAPGGSADIAARLVTDAWSKSLGGTIVVENRAGAGGNIGVDAVAKSPADGYTIGLQTVSLAINPGLFPRMPYDTLKDLAPIGMVASSQHVLVINNKVPAKNLQELVALAKAKPDKLTYGSAGNGSTFHMSAELFKSVANVSIVHVPYRGGGPALVDTIAGQVDMSFPVVSAAQQHVQGGKLTALAVTGSKRSPSMPNVPTAAEAGLPDYQFETWFMVFAPTGTPKAVIDKLNATLNATLASQPVKERMVKEGFEPTPTTPEAARQRLEKEMPMWAKLIKQRGIVAE